VPFICMIRTDIPNGILQVLDLRPNTSQRNLIYEPPGQSKYVNRLVSDTVATSGAGPIITVGRTEGLAAYMIDRVEDQDNAGIALTAARANAIATSLIATMDGGGAVTAAVVNAAIQAATGGGASTLDGGNSTGVLADVLQILAGGEYVVPAGTEVETAGNLFVATISGAFTDGQYRATYDSGSLNISIGEGHLSELIAATFEYDGTVGAAVLVLDDDGTVMT